MPITGTVGGEPIHYYDDYLFKAEPLPNATSKAGVEQTLNNTLGSLQIRGILNNDLTIPEGNKLTITQQYRDEDGWKNDKVLCLLEGGNVDAGTVLFNEIPVPDSVKRKYRLLVEADFDASATTITCPIELMPR